MKIFRRRLSVGAGIVAIAALPQLAVAGGGTLPGAGAVSTSRAGAAVASADDGEAVGLNPAGIAKAEGTVITLSTAMIQYALEFQRRGTYDAVNGESYPYAGQSFNRVKNDAGPSLGLGSFQAIPVVAVITDLGGRVPGLHLGLGLYAPNAYPTRDLCVQSSGGCLKYDFVTDVNNPGLPPPGTRYDVMKQEVALFLPSLVAAYRVLPQLDVGLRLSAGFANLKSTTALWGLPLNYEEDIKRDSTLTVDVTDNFVPAFGIGATYRPTPNLEFGFNFSSQLDIYARGTGTPHVGPSVTLAGAPVMIGARANAADIQCAPGGTMEAQKACIDFALPRNAQIGGRYKFLDAAGRLRGDVELDLDWQNWGKSCDAADFNSGECVSPGDYRVVIDADAYIAGTSFAELKEGRIPHGFRDTLGVRVGGSYHLPLGAPRGDRGTDELIVRGGLGYDTAAARTGWLRLDIDGASRTMLALGAAYRARRFEISLGGGAILEGSPTNPNVGGGNAPCNPTIASMDCSGSSDHQGLDPIAPLLNPDQQALSPVNQGDYKARYVLLMLGASTWF